MINHAAFDVLTEKSCYYAGLLYGDGAICRDRRAVKAQANFQLDSNDEESVRGLAVFIEGSDARVRTREYLSKLSKKGKISRQWRYKVTSDSLVSALSRFNVVPRKSVVECRLPELGSNLRHFLRGVIDADGVIGEYGENSSYQCKVIVYGVKSFCESIKAALDREGFEASVVNHNNGFRATVPLFRVTVWSGSVPGFLVWLYDGATCYLSRKKCVASSILKEVQHA